MIDKVICWNNFDYSLQKVKQSSISLQSYLFILCCEGLFHSCNHSIIKEKAEEMPNVVVILADDLGWADLTSYGSCFYETPYVDSLANDGTKYTNAYAASPVCSPSRASIQTGLYPSRTGVTDWIPGRGALKGAEEENRWLSNETKNELSLSYNTIAENLQKNGYRTLFSGKWHLGEEDKYWPEHQGYEINKGGFGGGNPSKNNRCNGYFSPYCNPRLIDGAKGEYLTDRLGDETVNFIKENKNTPFFVMLSFYQVHTPLQAKEAYMKKYYKKRKDLGLDTIKEFNKNPSWVEGNYQNATFKERLVQSSPVYAGMVQSMDDNVGKVVGCLKKMGLYENTLIIFTSDNGGLSTAAGSPTTNKPLRAGKGWLYEGGIRVPFIIKKPYQKDTGKSSTELASSIDIAPTIVGYLGIDGEQDYDGVNLLDANFGKNRMLFWHYPHYGNQGANPGSAIRKGKYKLIQDFEKGTIELYNLEIDIEETKNIAMTHPKIVEELNNELDAWRKKTDAKMMRPNPIWNRKEEIIQ